MKEGDVVLITFEGKEKLTGKIFDTTDLEVAKKEGIYREDALYGVFPIVLGKGELIKGLEEAILEMNKGEEKTVDVPSEKAFGERNPELVRLVPLADFKNRKLNPVPGMIVEVNGVYGKVQSVSGGRVRVDFNSELAGKTLVYKVKVEDVLTDKEKQADSIAKKYFSFTKEIKTSVNSDSVEVKIPTKEFWKAVRSKPLFAKSAINNLGFKTVKYVEEFTKEDIKEEK